MTGAGGRWPSLFIGRLTYAAISHTIGVGGHTQQLSVQEMYLCRELDQFGR
jgi:hypothetical protein